MKTKKIFTVIVCLSLIIAGAFVINNNSGDNNIKIAENNYKSGNIKTAFSESPMSDKELKQASDIIIAGTVSEIKEKGIKSVKNTINNETFNIEIPVTLYNIDVTEEISSNGKVSPKKLVVAITDTNVELEVGKEYTFLLYKITGDSELSKYYGVVSYGNGLYQYDKGTQELTPIREVNSAKENNNINNLKENKQNKIKYSDFKEKFK